MKLSLYLRLASSDHVLIRRELWYVLSAFQSCTSILLICYCYDLPLASSYFYLPIDEDGEDTSGSSVARHISWAPSQLDPDDFDASFIPSSSSQPVCDPTPSAPKRNMAIVNEILAQDDLYQILGISRASRVDKQSLRRAYLSRSKACHPEYVLQPDIYLHRLIESRRLANSLTTPKLLVLFKRYPWLTTF